MLSSCRVSNNIFITSWKLNVLHYKFINFYFIDEHCQYWLNMAAGTLRSQSLSSNGYPAYNHNLNCNWILNANTESYITLEIEADAGIGAGDYFKVYDGPDIQSPLISKLNNYLYKDISISCTGPHMLVQFLTDHVGSGTGFSAKIHHIPINPICKDWLNITSRFLTSPDYPTMSCSWLISTSIGSTISMQFHLFEVPYPL